MSERPHFAHIPHGIILPTAEDRSRYRELRIAGRPRDTGVYRGEQEYWANLRLKKNWRIHLAQESFVEEARPHADLVPEELEHMVVDKPMEEDERDALYFLHSNWEKIADLFYTGDVKRRVNPEAFVHVKVGKDDREIVDFLGIGPDGKIFLIISSAGKENTGFSLDIQYRALMSRFSLIYGDVFSRIVSFRPENKQVEGRVSSGLLRVVTRDPNGAGMME